MISKAEAEKKIKEKYGVESERYKNFKKIEGRVRNREERKKDAINFKYRKFMISILVVCFILLGLSFMFKWAAYAIVGLLFLIFFGNCVQSLFTKKIILMLRIREFLYDWRKDRTKFIVAFIINFVLSIIVVYFLFS